MDKQTNLINKLLNALIFVFLTTAILLLVSFSLSKPSTDITELYFLHTDNLTTTDNISPILFTFVVKNNYETEKQYVYSISIVDNSTGRTKDLEHITIAVPPSSLIKISKQYDKSIINGPSKIVVSLNDDEKDKEIYFWTDAKKI